MASTEPLEEAGFLRRVARGELPSWVENTPQRRAHVTRVAELMDAWATRLGLPPEERDRWLAAAWLHDALRDADPSVLRQEVGSAFPDLPPRLLHGPAAAERLRGRLDDEVADAIRYHTLGHPSFGTLGCALYVADFLEPGREFRADWRATLRARMPAELDTVLLEVLAARIGHLLHERRPIRPETAEFWSVRVGRNR